MNKNSTISLRVNSEIKEQAGLILEAMGLSFSDTFNLLLHQVRIQRRLPFDVVAYSTASKVETLAFIERTQGSKEELIGRNYSDNLK